MYEIKNGIMYKDGKKIFGLGAAYYASFHERKMAVPPDGDQLGEMKKDIARMKEVGFNIVRTSALGSFEKNNGERKFTSEPLIDEMMKEIEKADMAAFVRIQGYSMKVGDYDASMVGADGTPYSGTEWANFLNDSVHHPMSLADNFKGTEEIAKHYKDMAPVVSFITYNEPHYPAGDVYDYSPYAIASYRNWLKENNINLSDNPDAYEPPRRRPLPGERVEDWIYWRMFATRSLSDFLIDTSAVSKAVNPEIQSVTCVTPNMIEYDNYIKGCDYYQIAEGMDMLGITLYKNTSGADYYTFDMIINTAESAAATADKHVWMVELDAGTPIPIDHFIREVFVTIASGYKGVIYYQWRGDYPFEDAPEPNLFGFVNYDGTETEHYNEKIGVLKIMDTLTEKLANAEKYRTGVAVLSSEYGALYADAVDNLRRDLTGVWKNTYNFRMRRFYKELKREGITPDIVKAEHLAENKTGVKVLFVPEFSYLSDKEKAQVLDFQKNGGKVFTQSFDKWQSGLEKFGYDELGVPQERYSTCYELSEALEYAGIKPLYEVLSKAHVGVDIIEGDGCYVMSVVNISKLHGSVKNLKIRINDSISGAEIYTPDTSYRVDIKNNEFTVPEMDHGVIIVIEK